jgi:hypothetical protein
LENGNQIHREDSVLRETKDLRALQIFAFDLLSSDRVSVETDRERRWRTRLETRYLTEVKI